jgi:hypothetical protein
VLLLPLCCGCVVVVLSLCCGCVVVVLPLCCRCVAVQKKCCVADLCKRWPLYATIPVGEIPFIPNVYNSSASWSQYSLHQGAYANNGDDEIQICKQIGLRFQTAIRFAICPSLLCNELIKMTTALDIFRNIRRGCNIGALGQTPGMKKVT